MRAFIGLCGSAYAAATPRDDASFLAVLTHQTCRPAIARVPRRFDSLTARCLYVTHV